MNAFTAKALGLTINLTSTGGYTFNPEIKGQMIDSLPESADPVIIYTMDTEKEAIAFVDGMRAAGMDPATCCTSPAPAPFKGLHAVIRQIKEIEEYTHDLIEGNGFEDGDIPVIDMTSNKWAIYSPNEASNSSTGDGFWSEDGWGQGPEEADLFTPLMKHWVIRNGGFTLPESTGNDARWVKMLLDVGMADAVATSDDADNCGDAAKFAEEAVKLEIGSSRPKEARTSELIGYWDGIHYHEGGDTETEGLSFECEIHDMRSTNGQVTVDIVPESGSLDDGLYTTLEINRLNGSRDECPCLHVAFDGDNMAFSLYKQGDKIILKLEADVEIRSTVLPDGKAAFIID